MTFHLENTEAFELLFDAVKEKISKFEGCQKVTLLKDIKNPSTFFTYSIWDSETALDLYRKSAFFDDTWTKTKALFSAKAVAWSLEEH